MATRGEGSIRFKPRGVSDTLDGDNSPPGAMTSLSNLIYNPSTPNSFIARSANTKLIDFTTWLYSPGAAGVITDAYQIDNIIYGLAGITGEPLVYVSDSNQNHVKILDPTTGAILKTINVGTFPTGLAITPDGAEVWVCNNSSANVSVISTATQAVVATIALTAFSRPNAIVFTPDGLKAYVVGAAGTGRVFPITVSSRAVAAAILVGTTPEDICMLPDGSKAYVSVFNDNTVVPITIASNTAGTPIAVGVNPYGIVVTPDGAHVYVTNSNATTTSVIATASNTVSATVTATGADSESICIAPNGLHAYVASRTDAKVYIITIASNTVTGNITVGSDPTSVRISADGLQLYTANHGSSTVSVISTVSNTVILTSATILAAGGLGVGPTSFIGVDYPFAYNTDTSAFLFVSGITLAKCPVSQAITGPWTPPQMTLTGVDLVSVHVGFDGTDEFFGYFDLTTPTAPVWNAGNTATHGLPSVPQAAQTFNNRTYFFCANVAFYTDTLALTMTNANQSFTIGDLLPVTCAAPLPVGTTSQGILQGILAFKTNKVFLITGDVVSSDLSTNLLSPSVGTAAPRSVVPTPDGVPFMANDGIRKINFFGVVSEPDADLAIPFIYSVTPTRVAAAFNADTYRICVQNGAVSGSPYQDYWYSIRYRGWTGPHTFKYDIAVPLSNDFVLGSNDLPGGMWNSFSVQGHNGTGSSFVENGTQLTWNYTTSPMTDLDNIYANSANRTTLELALPSLGQTYNLVAQNENGNLLASAAIMQGSNSSTWGQFNWGQANWGASTSGLVPITIPWDQAVVFNKLSVIVVGASSLGFKIGSLHLGYKRLNYLLN